MSSFEKWLLWSATAAVAATGILLGWMKYFVRSSDPYAVVHHPLQPLVLKAHVLSAPFLVFAAGVVYTRHVVRLWRTGRPAGRRSGIAILATLGPMVLSGYAIQTFTSDTWVFRAAITHIAASLLYLVGLGIHRAGAKARARRDPVADPDS
ncbi:MAG TPA: hypothetical protein VFB67_07525 [Candidatus Polarisedimenticolaceae bacterium]|nr:hypothetical protein [Candidatus Polarisedimenticolaceae bacterium]